MYITYPQAKMNSQEQTKMNIQEQAQMNPQEQAQMTPILQAVKPQKKSWALMAIEAEEEEEQERKEEEQRLLKEQIQIRKELYARGEYELEDGEVLE
jgi:hypothetical protein